MPPKRSCFFCPFGSLDRWRWLRQTHPDLYAKAVALEEHSKHFPAQRLADQAFRNRTDITLRSLGEIFDRGEDLPMAMDVEQRPLREPERQTHLLCGVAHEALAAVQPRL